MLQKREPSQGDTGAQKRPNHLERLVYTEVI